MAVSNQPVEALKLYAGHCQATGETATSGRHLAEMGVAMHRDFVASTFGEQQAQEYIATMAARRASKNVS